MTAPSPEDVHAELRGAQEELAAAKLNLKHNLLRPAAAAAYYAIFHAARAVLWSRGKEPKTHRGLAQLFREEFIVSAVLDQTFLEILNHGRRERERAQYETFGEQLPREQVETLIQDAERFVGEMDHLLRRKDSTP